MTAATAFLATLLAGLLSAGSIGAAAEPAADTAPPADPAVLAYGPLQIDFPKPQKVLLPDGLLVYLFPDRELPLINLALYIKSGSIYDPAGKIGLADLATRLMRAGGAGDMSPEKLDEALDFIAARASFGASEDAVSGSLSARSAAFPEALRLFAAVLMKPRFDARRLDTERARMIESVRRRWDDPAATASINFQLLVYGDSSPWARLPTHASLQAIDRQDLIDFHRRWVHPNNMVLGVAGDFDTKAMTRLLRDTFAGWGNAKVTPPPVPKVKDAIPVGLHLIDRPVTQSTVVLGHLGVNRFAADKFPLKILNFILGEGGFSSWLVREVRSTLGLAYAVGGGVGFDSDRGLFMVACNTKGGSTVQAIEAIRDVLRRIRSEGPTEDEVRRARESEINSFVFSVDGTTSFMRSFLYYDYYQYPADFLRTYRDNLGRVTRAQVIEAARRHIDPDRLVVMVVGNAREFDRPLTTLGLGEAKTRVPPAD